MRFYMKHNWTLPRQLYYENQYLHNHCKELNEKIQVMEVRNQELVFDEHIHINKISLLEKKIVSLKGKLKKKSVYTHSKEHLFYLDSPNIEDNVSLSNVSSLTDSNN